MDSSRRNLSTLQQTNTESQNARSSKKSLLDYYQSRENETIKTKMVSKMTQVSLEAWVSDEDLSNEAPTETYWKVMAEKRRLALESALKENERLWLLHESLTKENAQTRLLLDEANSFMEVFKEVIDNAADDTGIDVRDISLGNEDERN